MDKVQFLENLEKYRLEKNALEQKLLTIKEAYIEANKPEKKGDIVKITLSSGRKVKGQIVSYGILKDNNVCITCYKEGNTNKYITTPHGEVELLYELMENQPTELV